MAYSFIEYDGNLISMDRYRKIKEGMKSPKPSEKETAKIDIETLTYKDLQTKYKEATGKSPVGKKKQDLINFLTK